MFNSKRLEELESIQDSVSELEEEAAAGAETETFDDGAESAMAWRRGMIERAALAVKKNSRRHIDPESNYPLGTLLFDRKAKKFGRVVVCRPGVIQLAYLRSGQTEIRESQINIEFEITPQAEASKGSSKSKSKTKAPPAATKPAAATKLKTKTEPVVKAKAAEPQPKVAPAKKAPVSKAAPAQKSKPEAKKAPAKVAAKSKKPIAKAPAKKPVRDDEIYIHSLPKGVTTDPIADPNGYIRQNYRLMSNKELATITGLSEHTIRRKLGEWSLKRPK